MRIRSAVLSAMACAPALAGPLAPPAGPVGQTGRFGPRIELSQATTPGDAGNVFIITQPGSYYLGEDLTVPSSMNGILLSANNVEIDLNGFRIAGLAGSLDGIRVQNFFTGVVIRDGGIQGMGGGAIAPSGRLRRGMIESLIVLGCASGVGVDDRVVLRNCNVAFCPDAGIETGNYCVLESCVASQTQGGVGIETGFSCQVVNCKSNFSSDHGIRTGNGCLVRSCVARANSGDGIRVGEASLVVDSLAAFNLGDGASLDAAGRIERCLLADNTSIGITAGPLVTVRGCSVQRSGGHGIFLDSRAQAIGNTVTESGFGSSINFSGIVVFADRIECVIDSNVLIGNETNINVFGTSCIVTRNFSLAGVNSGIAVGAGNFSGGVATLGGAGSPGPWVNIQH